MPTQAYAHADERTKLTGPPDGDPSAFAHADERTLLLGPPVGNRSAFAHADERSVLALPVGSLDAFAHADELVTAVRPKPPGQLMVWNPDLGQYVRDPWFYWDPNTSTWVQAL